MALRTDGMEAAMNLRVLELESMVLKMNMLDVV